MAELHLKLKDTKSALADYTELIRYSTDVKSFGESGYPSYTAYAQRAKLRYDLKDYRGAIADYTQLIRVTPGGSAFDGAINSSDIWGEAYHNRSGSRERLGDIQGAIADLRAAIRLKPNYIASLYATMAELHLKLKDTKSALADYTERSFALCA